MHLFQVGVGSGGIVVLDLIARDPALSRATLVDPDIYSRKNVHRHSFPLSGVGRQKVELAAEWMAQPRAYGTKSGGRIGIAVREFALGGERRHDHRGLPC